jgi:hypothetical protein
MLALHSCRAEIVVIGGWAHRLFRLHGLAQALDFEPLGTQDVDIALPANGPAEQDDLAKVLANAGFTEEWLGSRRPPVTYYRLGDDPSFYVEFLTPMVGRPGAFTREIAGVSAQALRHLDILLIEPWSVSLKRPDAPAGTAVLDVRLANAASYLAQKVLVLGKRTGDDRAKDILYLHDTLLLFGQSFAQLKEIWKSRILPAIHPNAARTVRSAARELFGGVTDVVRVASTIAGAAGRPNTPEEIAQVCRTGLAQVFS